MEIIVIAGIGGFVGWLIGRTVGYGTACFWLGLLLGPFGWIIALMIAMTNKSVKQRQHEEQIDELQRLRNEIAAMRSKQ